MIREYLNHLRSEGRSPNTLANYSSDLCSLEGRLSRRGVRLVEAIEQDIELDIERQKRQGTKANTIARSVVCTRGFFNFLVMKGVVAANPLARVRQPKTGRSVDPSRLLAPHELEALLHTENPPGPIGKRNTLMLKFLAGTPLRLPELAELTMQQIDLENGLGPALVRGERKIRVFFRKDLLEEIREYVRLYRPQIPHAKTSVYLFPSRHGGYMTRQAIWNILLRCKRSAGIHRQVTATDLRRSYRAHYKNR
jgi:integrase/recombinase XerD